MSYINNTFVKVVIICICITAAGFVLDRDEFAWGLFRGAYRSDEQKIRQAVKTFNLYFMDVYASGGSGRAIDAMPATKGMRHRLYKDAGFLHFGNSILVYDLASLEVDTVKITGPRTAEATTKEEWNYQYKEEKTHKNIGAVRGKEFASRYLLVKEHGVWLVQRFAPIMQVKQG